MSIKLVGPSNIEKLIPLYEASEADTRHKYYHHSWTLNYQRDASKGDLDYVSVNESGEIIGLIRCELIEVGLKVDNISWIKFKPSTDKTFLNDVCEVIRTVLSIGWRKVKFYCIESNQAGMRFISKLEHRFDIQLVGIYKNECFLDGIYHNLFQYEILSKGGSYI